MTTTETGRSDARVVPAAEREPLYAAYRAAHEQIERLGDDLHDDSIIQTAVKAYEAKLIEQGRLLPPGGEVSIQWEVRSVLQDGFVTPSQFDNEFSARDLIEKLRASNMPWVKRIDLARRSVTIWPDGTQLLGPWSPVVPDSEAAR